MTFKIWKNNTNSAIQMRFHFKCDHCNCVLLFLPSFNKCSTWFILPAVGRDKTRFELNALRVIALQFAVKTFPSCLQTRWYCGFINILWASNFIDFLRKSVSRISIYTQLKIGIPWVYCIPRNPALSVLLPLPLGYNVREARQTGFPTMWIYWWNQSVCCILYQIFLSSLLFVVVDIIGFLCKFFFLKTNKIS